MQTTLADDFCCCVLSQWTDFFKDSALSANLWPLTPRIFLLLIVLSVQTVTCKVQSIRYRA